MRVFFVVSILFVFVIFVTNVKRKPCDLGIHANIAGIDLLVSRAYDLGNIGKGTNTHWGSTSFFKSDGETYTPKMEKGCKITEVNEVDSINLSRGYELGYVSYSAPSIFNGQIKGWISRRIVDIETIGGEIQQDFDELQVFINEDTQQTYLVLPTSKAKTALNEPVIFLCSNSSLKSWCHTSYFGNAGLLIRYDIYRKKYSDAYALLDVDQLVRRQLELFIDAANKNQSKVNFILKDILQRDTLVETPYCMDTIFGNAYESNLTIKVGKDYYRFLNLNVVVNSGDKKYTKYPPCDVEYIEGLAFSKRSIGSIRTIDGLENYYYKKRYEQDLKNFDNVNEIDGVKELLVHKVDRVALLSQSIAPTEQTMKAMIWCTKIINSFDCDVFFHQKDTDVIVSYSKRIIDKNFDRAVYLSLFIEAEKWVNGLRDSAKSHFEHFGYR